MKNYFLKLVGSKRNLVILYVLLAIGASVQSLEPGVKSSADDSAQYTKYNNYIIFKKSFDHLKNNEDLYILYPEEHWDLFKYTPTFAAFFGIYSIMPDWMGLTLWNLLNALLLLLAVYYLPKLDQRQKGLILVIMAIELMTSLQNEQSNALISGLLIFSFGLLEKKHWSLAALCIVLSAFVKLFGVVGFALFLFYPKKWKLAAYALLWTVVLMLIPFGWLGIDEYVMQLESYGRMLSNDHSTSFGYSVLGVLNSWFSLDINKNIVVFGGVVFFLLPLAKWKMHKEFVFKYLTMTSVLIWVVIFNHKAESPTFILAMAGVSLWFVLSEKNKVNIALFASAVILTMLSPTDIFPRSIRIEWVHPYALKALPCILIWLKIIFDMMKYSPDKRLDTLRSIAS